MSGVVDPETLYTKQNCIGMLSETSLGNDHNAHSIQVVVVLGKSTRGTLSF